MDGIWEEFANDFDEPTISASGLLMALMHLSLFFSVLRYFGCACSRRCCCRWCCCCCCCCRFLRWCPIIGRCFGDDGDDGAEAVAKDNLVREEQTIDATVAQLRPRKSVFSCYALVTVSGLLGGHHFYLGRYLHGVVALWTANLGGLGLALDLFLMPFYVVSHNRRLSDLAQPDGSRRTLLCKLPLVVFTLVVVLPVTFLGMPWALRTCGLIDLDGAAGPDGISPYRVLGVPTSASLPEVKTAYRRESLKWHPDRNPGCGPECDQKMADITRAFAAVKKRAPAESAGVLGAVGLPAGGWTSWLAVALDDWRLLGEVIGQAAQSFAEETEKTQARQSRDHGSSKQRSRGKR